MSRPALASRRRVLAIVVCAVLAGVVASGCTGRSDPGPTPTSAPTTDASSAVTGPTSAPTSPAGLVPDGSAEDNLALFRSVTQAVWNSSEQGSGRAYVDALVAAGFDKATMQVTDDTTTLGEPAESIQFSVLWKDGWCLVGQVGPATGAPVAAVLPSVGDGMCLLGRTRPIDW